MIKVYEIKSNGFIGAVKEIDPKDGVGSGWTYTPPPADGAHKWENSQWVAAIEPEPSLPGPDLSKIASNVRAERNKRLGETDWLITKAFELGQPVDPTVLEVRQSLRDITLQPGFPLDVQWPSFE